MLVCGRGRIVSDCFGAVGGEGDAGSLSCPVRSEPRSLGLGGGGSDGARVDAVGEAMSRKGRGYIWGKNGRSGGEGREGEEKYE